MGYFCLQTEETVSEYIKVAKCNLRLHSGQAGYEYLIDTFALGSINKALDIMKQQIYEAAFEDVAKELNEAKEYLSNIGKYDDTASQVTAAIARLDRALEIYNETKNISTPALSGRKVQEG